MNLIKLTAARFCLMSIRQYSSTHRSSKFIRQQFLDFFINGHNHSFVKSSSVIPFCDPTLSFCNAGMNQFKNILLGNQNAKYKRVANSQKCIRVGGKHNDLSIVGTDSYHHTFFEMLGNWSFDDYFKKEACEMAWKLLTEVYKIPSERLYVTYFKGDEKMRLEPDLECKDIWRQIGVSENRLIGFGAKENFWEMGATGPCGGCSEIHIDHLPSFQSINRSSDVNRDKSDLTELWNIVFIEYFRQASGAIEKLPARHIDTGMGFERLVAFLQDKGSNYDTDLFLPIFDRIQKATNAPDYSGAFDGAALERDTAYRMLADHSRMIAVSLSDGMFPEQNQKLRRVLRKCINISEKDFHNDNLLLDTIPAVVEILGDTFPELHSRLPIVLDIIRYEQEIYKSIRDSMAKDVTKIIRQNVKLADLDMFDYPGFVQGYKKFSDYKKTSTSILNSDFMYRLQSEFGFDLELMERLAELEGMKADTQGFETKMTEVKKTSRDQHLTAEMITSLDSLLSTATENNFKYEFSFDDERQLYKLEPLKTKIIAIIDQSGSISCTKQVSGSSVRLVLQKSPFYHESGGQESDAGFISRNGKKFQLKSLSSRKNCILHEIELNRDEPLGVGDEVFLHIDQEKRSSLTRNHSATHLLNSAMRRVTQSPIYQKSSLITSENLKIELACFGPELNHQHIESIENLIQSHIDQQPLERKIQIINSQDLQNENDIVMVPGEIYPDDDIRLVTFGDFSKELCCGTHVFNTKELLMFTFLGMKSTGRNSYSFTATTGPAAMKALLVGEQLVSELKILNDSVTAENFRDVMSRLRAISIKLNNSNVPVALLKKLECQTLTADIKAKIKHATRGILGGLLNFEMKSVVESNANSPFIIHNLSCSELMKGVSLEKATKHVTDRPVLIITHVDNLIKARCCVPSQITSDSFNAELWIQELARKLRGKAAPPRGQNPREVCNMMEKWISPHKVDKLLQDATLAAKSFAATKFENV